MTRVYGNKVTNTSSGHSRTWRLYADYSVSSTETAYTIKGTSLGVQNTTSPSDATMSFNANSLTVSYSGVLTASYKRTTKTSEIKGGATFEVYGTDKSAVIKRTRVAQTKSLTFKGVANSNTAWDGTSTKTVSFTIPARSRHTVSYDANGGSGSIPSFTKFYSATGETAYYETLSDGSGFSKAGYRVAEWNTMPDGSGTSYPISGYYTANGTTAVTLYAQWQATYVKPEIQNLLAFRVADASGGATPTVTSTGETGFCKFELVGGANYTFTSATVQFGTATAKSMTKSGDTMYGYSDVGSIAQASAYTVKVTVVVTGIDGISRTYTDSTYISKAVPVFDATPNSFALGGVARDVTGDEKPFDCYMHPVFYTMAGEIKMWAGDTIPNGWLLCDGSEVSKTDYPNLYAAIGDLWGVPNSSSNFKLPNLAGNVPVGYNSADAKFDTVGKTGGEKTHKLTPTEMPSHGHSGKGWTFSVYKGTRSSESVGAISGSGFLMTQVKEGGSWGGYSATPDAGGNGAHNNLQPYAVVKYIICAI